MDGYDLVNLRREIREFCESTLDGYDPNGFYEEEFYEILKEARDVCRDLADEININADDDKKVAELKEYFKEYDDEFDSVAIKVIRSFMNKDLGTFDSLENFIEY